MKKKLGMKRITFISLSLLQIISYVFIFIIFSFSKNACYESLTSLVSSISRDDSITGSANFNVKNVQSDITKNDIADDTTLCKSLTGHKTSGEFYNFRVIYNSCMDTFITFDDYEDKSLTLLPHTTSGTHYNAKNDVVFDWFEICMMFKEHGDIQYGECNTFVEIREDFARYLLAKEGLEYTKENCQTLIDTPHFITGKYVYNGASVDAKFQIANIILENKGNDTFYKNTFGDYICFYLYNKSLPCFDGYSVNFDFGTSTYDTMSNMKFIEKTFSSEKYLYEFNTFNIKESNINSANKKISQFLNIYGKISSNTKYINDNLCKYLSISLLVAVFALWFFFYIRKYTHELKWSFILKYSISFMIVYLIFHIISKTSILNIKYFSLNAITVAFIYAIISLIIMSIFIFYRRKRLVVCGIDKDIYI